MKIKAIYPPYIYSIQYDNEDEDEFNRLFSLWGDISYLIQFMNENKEYLKRKTWKHILNPYEAAQAIRDEAEELEDLFFKLNCNTCNGKYPEFEDHFVFLKGRKYECELELWPMKSYGTKNPSFLRIYAIKPKKNLFIITGGGIKLSDSIQDSPDIKDHVLQNIDKVRKFLREENIFDSDDIEE